MCRSAHRVRRIDAVIRLPASVARWCVPRTTSDGASHIRLVPARSLGPSGVARAHHYGHGCMVTMIHPGWSLSDWTTWKAAAQTTQDGPGVCRDTSTYRRVLQPPRFWSLLTTPRPLVSSVRKPAGGSRSFASPLRHSMRPTPPHPNATRPPQGPGENVFYLSDRP